VLEGMVVMGVQVGVRYGMRVRPEVAHRKPERRREVGGVRWGRLASRSWGRRRAAGVQGRRHHGRRHQGCHQGGGRGGRLGGGLGADGRGGHGGLALGGIGGRALGRRRRGDLVVQSAEDCAVPQAEVVAFAEGNRAQGARETLEVKD